MAKRKISAAGRSLFDVQTRVLERRVRRQRALFIPRLLTEAASSKLLDDEARDRAYQIAVQWADLETSGHMSGFRETAVDTQFLDQFFRDGLGYQLKTSSPHSWHLEHKYSVPGVGIADAALGNFPAAEHPSVLIELKDSSIDLDRDRSNGRTAVQQCWDYLNAVPTCTWGIVSNFSTIRLYHRNKGTLAYEEFSLQELRKRDRFNEFYCLFERGGLLPSAAQTVSRAAMLLARTEDRQKVVGDELYKHYQVQRTQLIDYLHREQGKDFDLAIHIAQKLLDRVIFIAFCEDRDLLREKCLERAWRELPPFSKAKNPRWQNFLALFEQVDSGGDSAGVKQGYNGLLFKHDPELDTLNLPDEPWTYALRTIGNFDFTEEVNVEVLGHLFERSVTELEKLRVGGLFALKANIDQDPIRSYGRKKTKKAKAEEQLANKMPKSAQRKRFGIYYTPPAFTGLIVERTLDAIVEERFRELQTKHKVDPEARRDQNLKKLRAYWNDCLAALKAITVCDPACGSGAFLIRAYDALDAHYKTVMHGLAGSGEDPVEVDALEDSIPDLILKQNLYGVDLSEQAVEITQLALWIRSARKNRKLSDLSKNIVWGNSLVADPAVDPKAIDWRRTFPAVFGKGSAGGFTCVIGNPPWERVKVQDREFFSLIDPRTAGAVSASDRKKRIAAMPKANPELHASYLAARDRAQSMLDYARGSKRYPLTGRGDVNLYMLFAELAGNLVADNGYVGLLVPSGISTDDTTKDFFASLMDSQRLVSLYDFENRNKVFEDVDGRFKFSAIIFGGTRRQAERADFVFFAHAVEDTSVVNKYRHIRLTADDLKLLNPNTKTCPIFRSRRDAELTKRVYRNVPILIDHQRVTGGNPWGVTFFTMFHQTNDAEHFHPAKVWEKRGYKLQGNIYTKTKKRALPLYEAKMVQAFDHRAASVLVEEANWVRQGQKVETSPVQHQNPEYCLTPRWWVDDSVVTKSLEGRPGNADWLLGFKDITSPTNERTFIASFIPRMAVTNKFVLMLTDVAPLRQTCLLGNLNSFVFDYVTRQKIGGITLNFFIVEQLPTLRPDTYDDKCPWAKRETLEHWISERVLKLSCTSEDMRPLASACDFKGSRGDGVHIWKEAERATLRAELDAAYFHLYGIERADVEYILGTFSNTGLLPEEQRSGQQSLWSRGSTGEMILEAYDRLTSR